MDESRPPCAEDPITIALADDHAIVRRSGCRSTATTGCESCEAADAAQALDVVERARPVVLVLDLEMPGPAAAARRDPAHGKRGARADAAACPGRISPTRQTPAPRAACRCGRRPARSPRRRIGAILTARDRRTALTPLG
jgi:CheY-like chemotaxis protein